MPLRKGHLALLIAASMLNNVVLHQNGHRVLVKGRAYKEPVPVESEDEQTEIEREVLRTAITVLDLRTGALEVIDKASGTPARAEQNAA
jgi:hypothetical protein